jgi:hypothetical protein
MNSAVRTLVVRFNNPLSMYEVPLFRGAVNAMMADRPDTVLFHNHTENSSKNGLRYAYPLIQYKRIGGKAAIVCVGDGADAIGEFFSSMQQELKIGERNEMLQVETISPSRIILQVWEGEFCYHIRKWLPLNKENYYVFNGMEGVAEKVSMLESVLVGNILSMAKSLSVFFDKKVNAKITSIEEPYHIMYKGVKMVAFDAEFKSNVYLPDYIGLGKGVSMGMGTVTQKID